MRAAWLVVAAALAILGGGCIVDRTYQDETCIDRSASSLGGICAPAAHAKGPLDDLARHDCRSVVSVDEGPVPVVSDHGTERCCYLVTWRPDSLLCQGD